MKYVSYLRVSTDSQGATGNGIEAQRKAVQDFALAEGSTIVREFVEVVSGSDNERPAIQEAMIYAQLCGGVLLVKTLDRISRDLHFITALEKSEVAFKIVDMPTADSFTLHIYGSLAARERELISLRTRSALSALKAKGVTLGKVENFSNDTRMLGTKASAVVRKAKADKHVSMIAPMIDKYRLEGLAFHAIAGRLNEEGLTTRRGGVWSGVTVKRAFEQWKA